MNSPVHIWEPDAAAVEAARVEAERHRRRRTRRLRLVGAMAVLAVVVLVVAALRSGRGGSTPRGDGALGHHGTNTRNDARESGSTPAARRPVRAFTRSTEVEIVLVGAQGSRRIQGASLHLVTDDDVARFQACRPEDGSEFLWGRTRVALSDARGRVEIESVDAGVWLLVTAPGMEFAPRLVRPPKVALSVLEMSRASEVFLGYHGNSHDPQVCWRYSIEYVVPGKRLRVSDLLGGGFEFEEL